MTWDDVRKIINAEPMTLGPFYSGQLKGHWSFLRTMTRYKFVSNLIKDKDVLDVGCGEGVGTWMAGKYTKSIIGLDEDERAISWAKKNLVRENVGFNVGSLSDEKANYDVVTAVDVIEHIPKNLELKFMDDIADRTSQNGFCIIGTPNIEMSQYESEEAKAGHTNMFNYKRLEKLILGRFHNVMMFGMNDEVVYTGFKPMCQYLMAIGVNKK